LEDIVFRKKEMTPAVEKYLSPKELAEELCQKHGLCLTVEYVQAIRRHSLKSGDKLFILGRARLSDLFVWIERHPTFTRRAA
jgi:hypothetical protein